MRYHYFKTNLVGGPWNSISLGKFLDNTSQQLIIAYNDHLDIYNWNGGPGLWTQSDNTKIIFLDRLAVFADLKYIQCYSNKNFDYDHLLLLTRQSLSLIVYDTIKNGFVCKYTMYLTLDDANYTWIDQEEVIWIVGNFSLTRLEVVKTEPFEILQTGCFRMDYRYIPKFGFRTTSGYDTLDFVLLFEHMNKNFKLLSLKFNSRGHHKKNEINSLLKDPKEFLGASRKFNLIILLTEDSLVGLDFNMNVINSLKLPQKYDQIILIEGDFPQWIVYFDARCMLFEVELRKENKTYILDSYIMTPFSCQFDSSSITTISNGIYLLQPGHIVIPSKIEDHVNFVFLISLEPLLRWKIGVPSAPSIFRNKVIFPVIKPENLIIKTAHRGMRVKCDCYFESKGIKALHSFAIKSQRFNYPILALSYLNKTQFLIFKERSTRNHSSLEDGPPKSNILNKKHTPSKQFVIKDLKLNNSISTDRTLYLNSLKTNFLLQVTPNEARIYSINSPKYLSHMPPKGHLFDIAARNDEFLILFTTGRELSVIELKRNNFDLVSKLILDLECNYISSKHSICALSFWNESIIKIYQLPDLQEIGFLAIKLDFGVQIKEILISTMNNKSYIFIALSNNELLIEHIDLSRLMKIELNKSPNISKPRDLRGLIKGTVKSYHANLRLQELGIFPHINESPNTNFNRLVGSTYYHQFDAIEASNYNNINGQSNAIFLAGTEPTVIQADYNGELIFKRINITEIRLISEIYPLDCFPNVFSWVNEQHLFLGGINLVDSFDSYSVDLNTGSTNVLEATHDSYSNLLILLTISEHSYIPPLDVKKNYPLFLQMSLYNIQDFNLIYKLEFQKSNQDLGLTLQIIHCHYSNNHFIIPSFPLTLKGQNIRENAQAEDLVHFFQIRKQEGQILNILPTQISPKGTICACSSEGNIFISNDMELLCLRIVYDNENNSSKVEEVTKYKLGVTITAIYSIKSFVYALLFDWSVVILKYSSAEFQEQMSISMPHSYDQLIFVDSTGFLAINDMHITPVDICNCPDPHSTIDINTNCVLNHFQGKLKLLDCSNNLNIYNDGLLFDFQLIKGFLWTSERGSFGEIFVLDSKECSSFHFISLLQKAIINSMSTFGDYSYLKWRYRSTYTPKLLDDDQQEVQLKESGEFIDGNLIEMFLNSSHSFKQQTFVETKRLAQDCALDLPSLEELVIKLRLFVQYTFIDDPAKKLSEF